MPPDPQELAKAQDDPLVEDREILLLPTCEGAGGVGEEIHRRGSLTEKSHTFARGWTGRVIN